ncbi:hypothetical protein [Aminobacter niigataensis]|uniref:hypothetical protein n=1 Tax=Aminobacter niigataensis TaxID=83265 RepID=UPI00298EFA38|nr:hypothetical protein [Aminobacter niigataensis]
MDRASFSDKNCNVAVGFPGGAKTSVEATSDRAAELPAASQRCVGCFDNMTTKIVGYNEIQPDFFGPWAKRFSSGPEENHYTGLAAHCVRSRVDLRFKSVTLQIRADATSTA